MVEALYVIVGCGSPKLGALLFVMGEEMGHDGMIVSMVEGLRYRGPWV